MAYMNQEKKAKIRSALIAVMPKGWKFALSVRNYSTIVCTITEAPFDLIGACRKSEHFDPASATYAGVNQYHPRERFEDECVADVFENIVAALNTDNHDRSDAMVDHVDVGHYVDLHIGRWDRPFKCTAIQAVTA